MKLVRSGIILAILVTAVIAANATPVLLTSYQSYINWGTGGASLDWFHGAPSNVMFTWGLCPETDCNVPGYYDSNGLYVEGFLAQPRLFTLLIPPSAESQRFTIDASNDPNFRSIADAITGVQPRNFFSAWNFDTLVSPGYAQPFYGIGGGGGSGLCSYSCTSAPGAAIDSLVLTVSPVYLYYGNTCQAPPNGNNWDMWCMSGSPAYDFSSITFTVDVYGSPVSPTPEPTTLLLLGSAFVGAASWRRSRQH
jgi:hypothetical protein